MVFSVNIYRSTFFRIYKSYLFAIDGHSDKVIMKIIGSLSFCLHLLLQNLAQFLDGSAFSSFQVQLQLLIVFNIAYGNEVIVMVTKGKPCPHFRVVFFVLMAAVAVLCIKVRYNSFEEKEQALRIGNSRGLPVFTIDPFFLSKIHCTSVSVGLIENI